MRKRHLSWEEMEDFAELLPNWCMPLVGAPSIINGNMLFWSFIRDKCSPKQLKALFSPEEHPLLLLVDLSRQPILRSIPVTLQSIRYNKPSVYFFPHTIDHLRRSFSLSLLVVTQIRGFFADKLKTSLRSGIRTHGPTQVAFEVYH